MSRVNWKGDREEEPLRPQTDLTFTCPSLSSPRAGSPGTERSSRGSVMVGLGLWRRKGGSGRRDERQLCIRSDHPWWDPLTEPSWGSGYTKVFVGVFYRVCKTWVYVGRLLVLSRFTKDFMMKTGFCCVLENIGSHTIQNPSFTRMSLCQKQ